jgi:hypothetical protein
MTDNTIWLAVLSTLAILFGYEGALWLMQRRDPTHLARTAHSILRAEWFAAVSHQAGSEILAVQTLRNALMSATMTASTAVLGLVGTVTLATPSLHVILDAEGATLPHFTPRLALELVLMALLFASLVCSAMAVRYYNHTGFICAMPVGSEERQRWNSTGASHLSRAGLMYSWGLRHVVLVAPILAAILHPLAGPVVAMAVVVALFRFDRLS